MDELANQLTEYQNKVKFFQNIENNDAELFKVVNDLKNQPDVIDKLIEFYDKDGACNVLRYICLQLLKNNQNISASIVTDIKNEYNNLVSYIRRCINNNMQISDILEQANVEKEKTKYLTSYLTNEKIQSIIEENNKEKNKKDDGKKINENYDGYGTMWQKNFKIFYTFFYFEREYKDKTNEFLKKLAAYIKTKLNLSSNEHVNIIDFDAPMKDGWATLHLYFYNSIFIEYKYSAQLKFIIEGDNYNVGMQIGEFAKKFYKDYNFEECYDYVDTLEEAINYLKTLVDKFREENKKINTDDYIKYVQKKSKKAKTEDYEEYEDNITDSDDADSDDDCDTSVTPLNQILYGPPGTGKTYNTVVEAIKILNNPLYQRYYEYIDNKDKKDFKFDAEKHVTYEDLQKEFNAYKEQGRIEFITFHQSYSYEEFVEGIRPNVPEGDYWGDEADKVKYIGKDGIFKRICKKAQTPTVKKDNKFNLNDSPKIWKVSLMSSGDNPIRTECMNNNHIRIGFDEYGEFITEETKFDVGGKNVLNAFINKIKIGDIVLSCYSADTIDAIGVVTSDYYWNEQFDRYKRVRDVKWLVKDLKYNIRDINANKSFSDPTVHEAIKMSLNDVINVIDENISDIDYEETGKNYVLIIDEINRGNISKIFGELITLIEEDKREEVKKDDKEYHTLKATLPYSGGTFSVPNNLYIIGTMNTSDRSIASVDIALRRRFKFVEMMPEPSVVPENIKDGNDKIIVELRKLFETLNKRICALLDRDHQIGHSYFIGVDSIPKLKDVWFDCVMPLLNEYFYGDWEKLQAILGNTNNENSFIKKIEFNKERTNAENDIFEKDTIDNILDDNCYYEFVNKSEFEKDSKFIEALRNAFSREVPADNKAGEQ